MKFNVFFIKKKTIFFIILLILIAVLLIVFFSVRSTSTTFNTITDSKAIKVDLTGDGKEDTLYVKRELNNYSIDAKIDDKSYYLTPDKKLGTLGSYYEYWPMKLTVFDISRDKKPEIFTQASDKGVSVQHVFIYENNEFKDIFPSNNNILGFIDSHNNKTPKVVSGKYDGTKMSVMYYMLIKNSLMSYSYISDIKECYLGKDTIFSFIKYIESLPKGEETKPEGIFDPSSSSKIFAAIGKLAGENNTYSLQDATFIDTGWNKDGTISDIKWELNLKGISNNNKEIIKNYKVSVDLKYSPDVKDKNKYIYKICSSKIVP